MTVYEPHPAEGYEWVNPIDPSDFQVLRGLDGRPRGAGWRPVPVRRVRSDPKNEQKPADFPWRGGVLVMRATVLECMREIIESSGEVLPLAVEDDVPLYVLNARAIDGLDYERSDIVYFNGSKRIHLIRKYVFRADVVAHVHIFRLPHVGSRVFVSQLFVDRVRAGMLSGLEFDSVWMA